MRLSSATEAEANFKSKLCAKGCSDENSNHKNNDLGNRSYRWLGRFDKPSQRTVLGLTANLGSTATIRPTSNRGSTTTLRPTAGRPNPAESVLLWGKRRAATMPVERHHVANRRCYSRQSSSPGWIREGFRSTTAQTKPARR